MLLIFYPELFGFISPQPTHILYFHVGILSRMRIARQSFFSSDTSDSVVVEKGSYYVRISGKCKYTFIKAVNNSDYNMSTAITIKPGKTIEIMQTKKHNYARWYKIKLTSNKKITYWSNYPEYVYIYNLAAALYPVGKNLWVAYIYPCADKGGHYHNRCEN